MKKILGIMLITVAIFTAILLYVYISKKGIYRGDFWGLIIDSIEFVVLIGVIVFLGILLITE